LISWLTTIRIIEKKLLLDCFQTYFPWKYMESHRSDFELDPEFLADLPGDTRRLYVSDGYISRQRRYRMLADPLDASEREPVRWPYTNDNKPRL